MNQFKPTDVVDFVQVPEDPDFTGWYYLVADENFVDLFGPFQHRAQAVLARSKRYQKPRARIEMMEANIG